MDGFPAQRQRMVERQVEEPKPPETFYLAWRSDESGAALDWWWTRMREPGALARLLVTN